MGVESETGAKVDSEMTNESGYFGVTANYLLRRENFFYIRGKYIFAQNSKYFHVCFRSKWKIVKLGREDRDGAGIRKNGEMA